MILLRRLVFDGEKRYHSVNIEVRIMCVSINCLLVGT